MADAGKTGSGKSLNMLTKQSGRMLKNLTAQIKEVRKNGDRARAEALAQRRKTIQSITERYRYNIRKRQLRNNGGEVPEGGYKKNQQYSRRVYTGGRMAPTRVGQVGQFRAEQGTGKGQNSGTRLRFKNQYQFGITRAYSTIGQGTGASRRNLGNLMKSGNIAINAGVKKGIKSYYRGTNNNRAAQNARVSRQGRTARVHRNEYNRDRMRTSSIIRRQRKDRRRNGGREFR